MPSEPDAIKPRLEIVTMSLPAGARDAGYDVTLVARGGQPPYIWTSADGDAAVFAGIELRPEGRLLGVPVQAGRSELSLSVEDAAGNTANTKLVLSVSAPDDPVTDTDLEILTRSLPSATVGRTYDAELAVRGGQGPYEWRRRGDGRSIAPGLILEPEGRIVGVPTATGQHSFELVVVDFDGQTVAVSLELAIETSQPTAVTSTCDTPIELALVGQRGAITARLPGQASNTAAGVCASGRGAAEAFFRVNISQPARVSAVAGAGDGVQVVLLTGSCTSGGVLGGCGAASTADVEPGAYLIGVFGQPGVEFQLSVGVVPVVEPPPQEFTCANPRRLNLSSGTAMVSGTLVDAPDEQRGTCYPGRSEHAFEFELTAPSDIRIENTDPRRNTLFYVRSGNCETGTQVTCNSSGTSEQLLPNLPAGTYYLFVESRRDPGGDFSVVLRRSAPTPRPSNDTCSQATPVQLTNDSAQVTGSFLSAMQDSFQSRCSVGPALYYTLQLNQPSRLRASITGSRYASIEVFSGSCASPTGLICQTSSSPLCSDVLPSGRYVIRVGLRGTQGLTSPFTLNLARSDPPTAPANNACTAAVAVTPGSAVMGTLEGAADGITFQGPRCQQVATPTPDVFYGLSLARRSDVAVQLTGRDLSSMRLGVFSGGCDAPNQLECLPSPRGTLTLLSLPAGELGLVVERFRPLRSGYCPATGANDFQLTVNVMDSPSAPSNDTCNTAEVIAFPGGIGSVVSVSGTTRGASNDMPEVRCTTSTRLTQTGGLDVVYRVDVPVAARLRVTATSAPRNLVAYLTSVPCGSTASVACAIASSAGTANFETAFALAPGSYFMVVDHVSGTVGTPLPADFSFVAELIAP